MFERYDHHGIDMAVRSDLKGKHREYCLCFACKKFHPGEENNCPIANSTYENCVKHDLVTPVWECKLFEENK